MAKFFLILTFFLGFQLLPAQLRIKSYNIENFSSEKSTNLKLLKKILIDNPADLIAVQEIQNAVLFKEFIEGQLGELHYKVVLSRCGGAGRQKLGYIYNSQRLQLEAFHEDLALTHETQPSCHRSSRPAAIGLFKDKAMNLNFASINVHLKAGSCQKCIRKRFGQLKKLQKIILDLQSAGMENIIAIGDFNTTEYDKWGAHSRSFKNFVQSLNMKDNAEHIGCSMYWSGHNRSDKIEEPSLLDHILITEAFLSKFLTYQTGVGLHCQRMACEPALISDFLTPYFEVSDHCPISVNLQ